MTAILARGDETAQAVRTGPEPVFILAPARSYSTVTVAILAGHPDIYAFPEMLIFDAATVGDLLNEAERRPWIRSDWAASRLSGVVRATADLLFGSDSPENVRQASHWLEQRSDWTTVRLMNYLLALIGPRVGLEKSPDTVFTDEAIDACVNAYPHARFLHLTRHPVTTQRSMHAAWERPALRGRELVVTAAAAWYLGHSRIIKTLARLRHEQWMRVRAEDVLTDPRGWLPRILEWLRLPADGPIIERMLRTEEWRFAGTGPDGDLYGGDPGFFRSPAIRAIADPGPVRFDPEWGLRETTCRRMAALAQYLGY